MSSIKVVARLCWVRVGLIGVRRALVPEWTGRTDALVTVIVSRAGQTVIKCVILRPSGQLEARGAHEITSTVTVL